MRPLKILQPSLALISYCHALFSNTITDPFLLSIDSHKRAGAQCGPAANGALCAQELCCSQAVRPIPINRPAILTFPSRACAAQEAVIVTLQLVFFNMDQHATRIKLRQELILPLSLGRC